MDNLDPTGHAYWGSNTVAIADCGGGGYAGVGGSSGAISGGGVPLAPEAIIEVATEFLESVLYITAYKAYAKAITQSSSKLSFDNYPRIHHIVPHGDFSGRDDYTAAMLAKAHEIMINAGVNPYSDNHNKIVVSSFYHATLHTNDYIQMVTAPIIALGDNATKEQIYEQLFWLRIIVAAGDPQTYGY